MSNKRGGARDNRDFRQGAIIGLQRFFHKQKLELNESVDTSGLLNPIPTTV